VTVFETHGHIQGTNVGDACWEKVSTNLRAKKGRLKVGWELSSESRLGTLKREGALTR